MGITRDLFLWGSRNERLREMLPRYDFVRRSVMRFMPGEKSSDALNAAEILRQNGMSTILTHLGENVESREETTRVRDHYLELLDLIHARSLNANISVKLTELGLDQDAELCFTNVAALAQKAASLSNFLWIDMEGSAYTSPTLKLFERIKALHPNTGVCLQAYLFRTTSDLRKLLPLTPRIRLVKGAYAEPPGISYARKSDTDESFFQIAKTLLEVAKKNGVTPGIATHDTQLIQRVIKEAGAMGLPQNSFEIQMLYGIRAETQRKLAKDGFTVRVLISYGTYWFPWYMRRLAERPANIGFVLKNMVRR